MKRLAFLSFIPLLLISCTKPQEPDMRTNFCLIDSTDTPEQIIAKAANIVPTQRQYDWQRQELTAFLHFGVNTYSNREWGNGTEDPAIFNPVRLDAEQWITALDAGGFQTAILTCKHHDGFCLWPSAYTEHCVKNSPWRDGKGDVVREVSDACHKAGMGFGVYLSPWDRNSQLYGTDQYNDYFVNQLTELLTNYGEVREVWFDGACGEGPNGKKQVYDFERWYQLIRQLQPQAVIAVMGPDLRWVGTETGRGREMEWSVVPADNLDQTAIGDNSQQDIAFVPAVDKRADDLGSRSKILQAKGLVWYPAETDVSIRPGWFYHTDQDTLVKTPEQLMDIYFTSVGRNGVLLLNIPPNTDGLLADADIESLRGFTALRNKVFGQNLLAGAKGTAELIDGNYDTFVTTPDKAETVTYTYQLPEAKTFNVLSLQEEIRHGQRVEGFTLEVQTPSGEWQQVASGTTIGYKRLLQFDAVTAQTVRLSITACRLNPYLSEMGLHYRP